MRKGLRGGVSWSKHFKRQESIPTIKVDFFTAFVFESLFRVTIAPRSWLCFISVSSRAFLYPTLPSTGRAPGAPSRSGCPSPRSSGPPGSCTRGPGSPSGTSPSDPRGAGDGDRPVRGLLHSPAVTHPWHQGQQTKERRTPFGSACRNRHFNPLPPPRAPPPRLVDERPDALLLVTRDILLRGTRGRAGITVARARRALFAPKRQGPSLGVNFAVRIFPLLPA